MAAMSAGNWNPVLKAFRQRLKGAHSITSSAMAS
jgi:phage/plasmid primase-like uncharacterized protein